MVKRSKWLRRRQAESFSQQAYPKALYAQAQRLSVGLDRHLPLPWVHWVLSSNDLQCERRIGGCPSHGARVVESVVDAHDSGVRN